MDVLEAFKRSNDQEIELTLRIDHLHKSTNCEDQNLLIIVDDEPEVDVFGNNTEVVYNGQCRTSEMIGPTKLRFSNVFSGKEAVEDLYDNAAVVKEEQISEDEIERKLVDLTPSGSHGQKKRIAWSSIRRRILDHNVSGDLQLSAEGEDGQIDAENDSLHNEPQQQTVLPGDDGMVWDFDEMMAKKKKERERTRRRHRDGYDLINDDDGQIAHLVDAMKAAAKDDRHLHNMGLPAFKKLKLLPRVRDMLLKIGHLDALIDNGMMSAVSEWLAPLRDHSLPCFEIRHKLLTLLQPYRLEQGTLRQSGLGKAVMFLYKHHSETFENKMLAVNLIREWARPIFNLPTDFSALTREQRRQMEYNQSPYAEMRRKHPVRDLEEDERPSKKRKESDEDDQAATGSDNETDYDDIKQAKQVFEQQTKMSYQRARPPQISHTAYVIRPKGLDSDKDEEGEKFVRKDSRTKQRNLSKRRRVGFG